MDYSSFHLTVKIIFHLLNVFALVHCTIGLKNLSPFCHPVRSKTKTNWMCLSVTHVFLCFTSATLFMYLLWIVFGSLHSLCPLCLTRVHTLVKSVLTVLSNSKIAIFWNTRTDRGQKTYIPSTEAITSYNGNKSVSGGQCVKPMWWKKLFTSYWYEPLDSFDFRGVFIVSGIDF